MSDDYEDDFDAYEDDFEPDEDYDVLPAATVRSTQPTPASKAGALQPPPQSRPSPIKTKPSGGVYVMDLPQAPLLSDVELRARNQRLIRSLKKMRNVQLQVVAMDDVFVMGTLSDHDLYCMGRGQYALCKVSATQTRDDAKEEECQTDEIQCGEFGSQVPDDRNKMTDAEVSASTVNRVPGSRKTATTQVARMFTQDPELDLKLASFMQWAGPVMLASLGLGTGASGDVSFSPATQGATLSSGLIHLSWDTLLAHRPVTGLALSHAPGTAQLIAAYAPVGALLGPEELIKDHGVSGRGCLCVWDLSHPSRPHSVMLSEGVPSCCAWAPHPHTHIVLAGMEDGGVCVWDLEEPASRHPTERVGQTTNTQDTAPESVVMRRPSFTTEAQPQVASAASIRALACVADAGAAGASDRRGGAACTVLALSAWGDVTAYSLSVSAAAAAEGAASDADLGARIGSRVRLLGGGAAMRLGLRALQRYGPAGLGVPCHCMGVLQGVAGPSAQVLVGTEGSKTLRGSWLGTAPAPKQFLSVDARSAAAVSTEAERHLGAAVTCIDVSTHEPAAFVVGLSDGSIALHSATQATAVCEWPGVGEGRIVAVCWAPGRPACFLALDAACQVLYFDLTKSLTGPIERQPCMVQTPTGPSLTTTLSAATLLPQGKAGGELPLFTVGYDDGSIDVHRLGETYARTQGGVGGEGMVLRTLLGLPDKAQEPTRAQDAGNKTHGASKTQERTHRSNKEEPQRAVPAPEPAPQEEEEDEYGDDFDS